jgi:hypothetical protein
MAGAGYKLFNTGDVLTAAQVNTYLQEQVVMVFADAAARTTALSGVLAEGMVSYLKDTNATEVYDGSAWVAIGNSGDITGVTAGTGISGGGTSGTVTITNSMATAIDAKGDLVAGTGSDTFARLAIGTNGQVLTADSTASTGMKWATAGGGDWVLVTASAASAVSSHSISSCFSSTYKVYKIYCNLTGTVGADLNMKFRVGSTDTSTNYDYQSLVVAGTTFFNSSSSAQTSARAGDLQTYLTGGEVTIFDPYAANPTPAFCLMSGNGQAARYYTVRQTDSTSFDGITFIAGSGTFTGTFYVYGLKA